MPHKNDRRINHIVVLMLENRSFDHFFGFMEPPKGQKIDNIRSHGDVANRLDPSKSASPTNPDFPARSPAPFAVQDREGPPHGFVSVCLQLNNDRGGPTPAKPAVNDGFVRAYRDDLLRRLHTVEKATVAEVMACFAPNQLPAINELARSFCLCDQWFCDVPSSTMSNRMFVHAATSEGYVHNAFDRRYSSKTVYELIEAKGLSWAVYFHDLNEVIQFSKLKQTPQHFRRFEQRFAADVAAKSLPNYSFIFPRFINKTHAPANSQHAPQDVRPGEHLIADVYDALAGEPELWKQSMLIVTYDEHGGFYDHVAPSRAPSPDGIDSPNPDDKTHAPHFRFDRLGLRVPAVIASPWIPRGHVEHRQLRHTSVIKTVTELFDLDGPLNERDRTANSFADLVAQLDHPRAANDMPAKLPRPALDHGPHSFVAGVPVELADEPLDALTAEWVQGFATLTGGAGVGAVSGMAEPLPSTNGAAAQFVEQRLKHLGI